MCICIAALHVFYCDVWSVFVGTTFAFTFLNLNVFDCLRWNIHLQQTHAWKHPLCPLVYPLPNKGHSGLGAATIYSIACCIWCDCKWMIFRILFLFFSAGYAIVGFPIEPTASDSSIDTLFKFNRMFELRQIENVSFAMECVCMRSCVPLPGLNQSCGKWQQVAIIDEWDKTKWLDHKRCI